MKQQGLYDPQIWEAMRRSAHRDHASLDQGGENCVGAPVIPVLPFSTTGTTDGYRNDYDAVCPFPGSVAPDVVYRYNPLASEFVDISLCGSEIDSKLYVFADDCESTPIACNDDACETAFGWPFASRIQNLLLPAGHYYYIVIDGYGDESGSYQLSITRSSGQCIVTPLQDNPSYGFTQWEAGDQLLAWMQPACGPEQPLALDSLTLRFADASAFGDNDGAGTLVFRISIICANDQNPCNGPNRWLYTSPNQQFSTNGLRGVISQTITGELCLRGNFFIALEFVSWSGNPLHVPSPLWDAAPLEPCHQWFCRGGGFDFAHLFDPRHTGNFDVTAYLRLSSCPAQVCASNGPWNCPPSARLSAEPVCENDYQDIFNGGCDQTPLHFEALACGDTVCAALGSFYERESPACDADWYQIEVADSAYMTCSIVAPFAMVARLYSAHDGCSSNPIAASPPPSLAYAAGDTLRLNSLVSGGSYWLEIFPYNWEYLNCGSPYLLWTDCVPLHSCNPLNFCCPVTESEPNNLCPGQIDPAELRSDRSLCGTICPAGDVDDFLWVVPAGVRGTLSVFSGDSCTVQPANVVLSLWDPETCLDASGGQPPSPVGWTMTGPSRLVLRAEGGTPETETRYRLTISNESIGVCPAVCLSAPLLPLDSNVIVNTCDGCPLYPGTFESECTGPQWISGLQRFFHINVPAPAVYTVTLTGDTTSAPGGYDVQFCIFSDCRNPDSSCVFSQDRNFPENEITGPGNTETGSLMLIAGDYLIGISSYDILESDSTCATMTLRIAGHCDPVQDLRCFFSENSAQTVLFWSAPQSGRYTVWSTTLRNNDGNPDDGADPQWTLCADLNLPQGNASWADPQPVQDYLNYVVVHNCH
jgi:hypothetical protein